MYSKFGEYSSKLSFSPSEFIYLEKITFLENLVSFFRIIFLPTLSVDYGITKARGGVVLNLSKK
jgi:hypothetical protein